MAKITEPVHEKRAQRVSQADVPSRPLEEALRIPRALVDHYAGRSARPLSVAQAVSMQPTSGPFRMLCGAAIAYGLTEGGYNAPQITITPLGRKILMPTSEGDESAGRREAVLKPRVVGEFLRRYDGAKIPREDIALNVLIEMGVPKEAAKRTLDTIIENADSVGFLRAINGVQYVDLAGVHSQVDAGGVDSPDESLPSVPATECLVVGSPLREPVGGGGPPKSMFVGHGKNKAPLEQLTKILSEYKIPFKVAVEEANSGRPISKKVADIMDECGAAIIIFSADEEFTAPGGSVVFRPSENAIYELGAASVKYGSRIIVFREKGVHFPTNFRDLGYIEFEKDQLTAKVNELFRELMGLGVLKFSTT